MGWEEKREHKRANIRVSVECRGVNFWQYVETRDLSAGGMFIATDKVEPPQTKMDVMFEIGDGGTKKFIHAEAVVTWSRKGSFTDEKGEVQPPGMGVMFTKFIPLKAKGEIESLIKDMEEKKGG
jgi:c-di-GMP-binding flagellar brake protein YcgR